ncbi:MAG: ribonuclease E/G [Pseudomonadota bacterium]
MAEWLVERGIGETRSLLVENGEVIAAKLCWPGELRAGEAHSARLISKAKGARRGVAALDNGREVLVDQLPTSLTEGQSFALRISRSAIAERGRFKRAQGRYLADSLPKDEAVSANQDAAHREVSAFEAGQWEEVWHTASSASLAFSGGEIVCSATPAMTVIDIDGDGSPKELGLAAVPAIARALRWFDIAGNIGIDFPSIEAKADRRTVDQALDTALVDWPHERTAMNGFGFVQLIARLEGPSLLHRFAASRTGMCARFALRAAERAEGAGPVLLLGVHPALKAKLKPEWIDELARRTGKQVRIETNPSLALEGPSAQILEA